MVYFGLYAVTFICGFYDFVRKSKKLTIFLTGLMFFLLFFTAGFRYETGWDWQNYTALINGLPTDYDDFARFKGSSGNSYESGYLILNYLVKLAGGNIQWVFAVMAFLSVGLFVFSLRRYTPYVFVTLLVYLFHVYYLNFSYIRQGFSIAVFFYALRFVKERNFKKYVFWIFISSLVHSSSLIVLPLYFILDREIKGVYYALGIMAAFMLMKMEWIQWFIGIVSGNNLLVTKFLATADKFGGAENKAGISSRFLEFLLLFTFCAWNRPFFKQRFAYFNIFLNCAFLYLAIYLLFNDLVIFVERIGLIFLVGPVLLYGFVIEKFKEQHARILFYLLIAAIIYLRGFEMLGAGGANSKSMFIPYRNYLVEWLQSNP